jgi:lysylphosphatidylglycerol synthetase-like protein (DUF2156 family)
VFHLTCELILGAHVGIVLIVVIPIAIIVLIAVKRFWNVWPNLRTIEKTLNALYSTGTILFNRALLRAEHSNSITANQQAEQSQDGQNE